MACSFFCRHLTRIQFCSIPRSYFLRRVRYRTFMNCFMTIHEIMTRKGHAKMRLVRQGAKEVSHNLSNVCFVA